MTCHFESNICFGDNYTRTQTDGQTNRKVQIHRQMDRQTNRKILRNRNIGNWPIGLTSIHWWWYGVEPAGLTSVGDMVLSNLDSPLFVIWCWANWTHLCWWYCVGPIQELPLLVIWCWANWTHLCWWYGVGQFGLTSVLVIRCRANLTTAKFPRPMVFSIS